MKKSVIYLYLVSLTVISLWQCNSNCPDTTDKEVVYVDNIKPGQIIADTITYDVIIKNFDTTQVWQEEFLKNLDRSLLIDSIFAGVYTGRFTPYDFFSGKEMSLRELRNMENEAWFSRKAIGKIQFSEIWYLNENSKNIEKKVISMVLGIEQFDNHGNLRGHKPVFKIYMNKPEYAD